MKFSVAVLPGDGIGPEVTEESVKILKKVVKLHIMFTSMPCKMVILILRELIPSSV